MDLSGRGIGRGNLGDQRLKGSLEIQAAWATLTRSEVLVRARIRVNQTRFQPLGSILPAANAREPPSILSPSRPRNRGDGLLNQTKMSEDKSKKNEQHETRGEDFLEPAENQSPGGEAAGDPEPKPEGSGAKPLAPVTLTGEEYQALVDSGDKAAENWDRFVRLNAEFDNFKKRAARDRLEAIKYANESLLESLIPTLDNFEMAMSAAEGATSQTIDSLKQGIEMVHKQLKEVIKESGMEEIDARDQVFDPAWHEALSQYETDEAPEGQVIQQIRKGYKLKERLIRPANVIVAKAKGQEPASDQASDTKD